MIPFYFLSCEKVQSILAQVKTFKNGASLSTLYSCGLRLHEGLLFKASSEAMEKLAAKITNADVKKFRKEGGL